MDHLKSIASADLEISIAEAISKFTNDKIVKCKIYTLKYDDDNKDKDKIKMEMDIWTDKKIQRLIS